MNTGLVTTVTLDPWIELVVEAPALRAGERVHATSTKARVRGRGVNVSIALRALGVPNVSLGLSFADSHALLAQLLERNAICQEYTLSQGQMRTELLLIQQDGAELRVRCAGDEVPASSVEAYLALLRRWGQRSGVVALKGPLPDTAPSDLLRRSLAVLKGLDCQAVVAVSGQPLREALRRRPALVQLSRRELEATFRARAGSLAERLDAVRYLRARGACSVCLSAEDGVLYGREDGVWFAPFAEFPADGQEAADALTAGLCCGLWRNAGPEELLRLGMAAASATAVRTDGGLCRWHDTQRLFDKVKIERVDKPAGKAAVRRESGK